MKTLKDLVSSQIGDVSEAEIIKAFEPCSQKLMRIIQHEGDSEGTRLSSEYLSQLIAEHIISERASEYTEALYNSKRRVAQASTPHITIAIVSQVN